MVCPYGWDTPGGVQTHIRDLAEHLIDEGHFVSVLTPISDDSVEHQDYVVNAGKPISIPVNGSVARVLFGPIASSRAKQWIASGDFDLLHLHEPAIPSLSLLAPYLSVFFRSREDFRMLHLSHLVTGITRISVRSDDFEMSTSSHALMGSSEFRQSGFQQNH